MLILALLCAAIAVGFAIIGLRVVSVHPRIAPAEWMAQFFAFSFLAAFLALLVVALMEDRTTSF